MKSRVFFAALCILFLPLVFAQSRGQKLAQSAPFATAAFAGRTVSTGWCQCGCPQCICDPDETPTACNGGTNLPLDPGETDEPPSDLSNTDGSLDVELGAAGLLFAIGLMWTRFRY